MQPNNPMPASSQIYVAGHRGMVGSAIVRRLNAEGYRNIVVRTREELDLIDQAAVRVFFQNTKIDYVILAAAKVGGILANNTRPAEFIYQNLMIEANVIHAAFGAGVQNLLLLGSSCIYPKHAPQPMKEEYLLSDRLEPTNEPYAVAKIAGIKLCEAYNRQYRTKYRAVMPTNLYGPNDNYDLENSHVLPALIRKFHLAKLAMQKDWQAIQRDESQYGPIPGDFRDCLETIAGNSDGLPDRDIIQLWGSGSPKREFLHVDDLAAACFEVINLADDQYEELCATPDLSRTSQDETLAPWAGPLPADLPSKVTHINIGAGRDISISELSEIVKAVVGFAGQVDWDRAKPDGTPRKLLDVTRLMRIGWRPRIGLKEGIRQTYTAYIEH
jgi:GDP-L-fucose synthase